MHRVLRKYKKVKCKSHLRNKQVKATTVDKRVLKLH